MYDPVKEYEKYDRHQSKLAEQFSHRQCGECEDFEESEYRVNDKDRHCDMSCLNSATSCCCYDGVEIDCRCYVGKCKRDGEYRLSCDRGCEE